MDLSLIIPFHNEEENLQPLIDSIEQALNPLGFPYEVVMVDDGSTDKSRNIVKANISASSQHIKMIELTRNYGQTAAIAAGIDHSKGDVIVLVDADLQNDPSDIPLLLEKINQGFDVVSGWRKDRKDKFLVRVLPSRIANALISWVTGVKLHDYGCTLKAYRREYLGAFNLYGEMHRFLPAYAHNSGAKIAEVVVKHHPRTSGKSHYGLDRTMKVILDLLTAKFLMSYAARPMRLFGGAGMGLITLGVGLLAFLAIRRVINETSVLGSPFFQVSVLVIILGFQSILMGMIAELLMRIYYETQGKQTYSIRSITSSNPEA